MSDLPFDARLQATLAFDRPVGAIAGVSARRASELARMGIRRVRDLLAHYPRRYIDMSTVCSVAQAHIGQLATIAGTIHEIKLKRPKPRLSLVEIAVVDASGIIIVTAFRQPWLADKLHVGDSVALSGKVEFDYGFKRMTNPVIEPIDGQASGLIVPVHPATSALSPAQMRMLIRNALAMTAGAFDPLPLDIRLKYRLMARNEALRCVHFPTTMHEAAQARRRLAFEELLYVQVLMMNESRTRSAGLEPTAHVSDGSYVQALSQALPFQLTGDQLRARDDALCALAQPTAANHMVLGDVGTGKTVIAAFALAAAADTKGQAFVLAPTEVLADQHYRTFVEWLAPLGMRIGMLSGSTKADERARIIDELAQGHLDVVVGTHALLEDDVQPKHCTLVIIDEQQRFGVDQRARLLAKGSAADALYLTATPIPRTLALALFGNMTLSYLKQKPYCGSGRTTKVLTKADRGDAYDVAKRALEANQQVYVVCALVGLDAAERSKAAGAGGRSDDDLDSYPEISIEGASGDPHGELSAAVKEASFLKSQVFSDARVELLHGGMPSDQKRAIMQAFKEGSIDVLVTTSVVEVGVDVPNATVMIIEDADRFGLSQLHQLRGRVGRAELPGSVFLISASKNQAALERLGALERSDDGFELAEIDLAMRREGDILGNRQSGTSTMKLVNVMRDAAMIEQAHACAQAILAHDPSLRDAAHAPLAREVRAVFSGEQIEYAVIGG